MAAPVWLLDVDGVVNATKPGWHAAPARAWVYSTVDRCEYRLRWAPALVQRLRALHVAGTVEIRWCTTWCLEAATLERLWHLPRLDRALTCEPMPRGSAAHPLKLAAARRVLAADRVLIWTDDAAVPGPGPLHDELTNGGRALLIAPSARRGLTPQHLADIEAFAARAACGDR
jgi:hypothetical protein